VFYRKKYLNSYYKIIVSGRVPNNCIKLLNNYFGYESTVRKNLNVVTSGKFKVPKSHKNFIQRDNALQSAIRIGCKVENITHKDFIPLKILNTVLGGYFGSRLMTNLREDKGYTYGIGSRVISFYDTGLFFITSEVDANATKDALVQIYKEIKTIREKLIDKEELELVKNFMLGTLLRAADGPFAQSSMLKNVIEYNLDLSYYTKYTEEIKSITSETLRDIANKYLEESKLVELVVGKL
ncbi:MAG: insulinase family protein, partial [Bacteroidota bacterium]|nr:insulinase family protein [Bacteroidota bacterium]